MVLNCPLLLSSGLSSLLERFSAVETPPTIKGLKLLILLVENLTNKDHIRGALKTYRKDCFIQIGKLKPSMGWDTVDELLAKYYKWTILTDETLHVKHLKPTGISYNEASKYLQGEAMYKMRYGFVITLISALKLAYKKRSYSLFKDYMAGYFEAKKNKSPFLVTKEQGLFIRKLRWKGMLNKFN